MLQGRSGDAPGVHTYDAGGAVAFREYYDLSAAQLSTLRNRLDDMAACAGRSCVR